MHSPLASVVIPCHNEGRHIGAMLERTVDALRGLDAEIIVVLDGCTDDSVAVVRAFAEHHSQVRSLVHDVRQGKGAAIKLGMEEATGRVVAFIDGDNEIDPSYARAAIERIEAQGADIVVGNRYAEPGLYSTTPMRRLQSRVYHELSRLLFGLTVKDSQAGMKAFTSEAARRLFGLVTVRGYAFDIELLALANVYGYSIEELPIRQHYKGTSALGVRHVIEMIVDTGRIFLDTRRVAGTTMHRQMPVIH